MTEVLYTKWGVARSYNGQHYKITSRKEGHKGENLHRLIWESYYGEIPDGFVIHHKNGIKTDNRISNLEMVEDSKHRSFHFKGKDNSGKNNPMYGNIHEYAKIIKNGHLRGQQYYSVYYNKKVLKSSNDPQKLLDWFLSNHPLEIIKRHDGGCKV